MAKRCKVRGQKSIEDTVKLFLENDFDYLFNANYLSIQEKEQLRILAENEKLIPRETREERLASITAQANLSDKQKHLAIQ